MIDIIRLFCAICNKLTFHRRQRDSRYWESYWCSECHVGQKYKVQ